MGVYSRLSGLSEQRRDSRNFRARQPEILHSQIGDEKENLVRRAFSNVSDEKLLKPHEVPFQRPAELSARGQRSLTELFSAGAVAEELGNP